MDFRDICKQKGWHLVVEDMKRGDGVFEMGVWTDSGVVAERENVGQERSSLPWQRQGGPGHGFTLRFGECGCL